MKDYVDGLHVIKNNNLKDYVNNANKQYVTNIIIQQQPKDLKLIGKFTILKG